MYERSVPAHIENQIEEFAPWDMFLIDASENLQVPPVRADVAFIPMEDIYPELTALLIR